MEEALQLKFTQHEDLKKELLDTDDADLFEASCHRSSKDKLRVFNSSSHKDSPVDSFWGIGADKQGRNELGKALMRVRSLLRSSVD